MKRSEAPLGVWQYFMLFLSVFALLFLAVQTFLPVDARGESLFRMVDNLLCIVFFADFLLQLVRTRPRRKYLKWGWLDLLSSIPILPEFRIARLARVIRIIRVLRAARASKNMFHFVLLHRARSTFGAVALGSIVLLLFSIVAIVNVEPSISPRDAFWWCLFTLITGEYGDFYPDTTEGRVITALLMTAGVAVFGTFTATVATFFLEKDQKQDERRDEEILSEVAKLTQKISEIKSQMKGQSKDDQDSKESN